MAGIYEIEIDLNYQKNNTVDLKEINIVDNNISYENFFNNYLLNNTPVVLKNIADDWISTKYWINYDAEEINFSYLQEKYGKSPVIIYNCNVPHYNSQKTECSTLTEYLNDWKKAEKESLYLKDWHLKNQFPNDRFYEVPIYFASDWLNEYFCECLSDDYRFVYVGPKDTWTPFHADVFTSFSWSTNVFGQKKWYLFPPGEELKLLDNLGNLPHDLSGSSLENCKYFEVIQNAGEALFVPSGWYHQVWNLRDTVSVNHNWVNGCNVETMWKSLCDNLEKIRKEIDDCKDMDGFDQHCQVMLKVSYGIDFKGFYSMLKHIAKKRIDLIKNGVSTVLFDSYRLGRNHAVFDLECILKVLKLFLNHTAVINMLNDSNEDITPNKLLEDIETCII